MGVVSGGTVLLDQGSGLLSYVIRNIHADHSLPAPPIYAGRKNNNVILFPKYICCCQFPPILLNWKTRDLANLSSSSISSMILDHGEWYRFTRFTNYAAYIRTELNIKNPVFWVAGLFIYWIFLPNGINWITCQGVHWGKVITDVSL